MPSSDTHQAELTAHPTTPNNPVRSLTVRVQLKGSGILMFRYSLDADISRLRLPPSGAGGRADALWTHTCFEAFVAPADAPGYHEFNFSPSLEWAVYRFSAYREGMSPAAIGQAPQISMHQGADRLELESVVRLGDLAGLRGALHLRIALAAVIEDNDGSLSYWALRHAPGKPDFHHPHGFALELPAHEIWN